MKGLIIIVFSCLVASCSPMATLTVGEVLYPFNDTHNMGHVYNERLNYYDTMPIRNNLEKGDQFRKKIPK